MGKQHKIASISILAALGVGGTTLLFTPQTFPEKTHAWVADDFPAEQLPRTVAEPTIDEAPPVVPVRFGDIDAARFDRLYKRVHTGDTETVVFKHKHRHHHHRADSTTGATSEPAPTTVPASPTPAVVPSPGSTADNVIDKVVEPVKKPAPEPVKGALEIAHKATGGAVSEVTGTVEKAANLVGGAVKTITHLNP